MENRSGFSLVPAGGYVPANDGETKAEMHIIGQIAVFSQFLRRLKLLFLYFSIIYVHSLVYSDISRPFFEERTGASV